MFELIKSPIALIISFNLVFNFHFKSVVLVSYGARLIGESRTWVSHNFAQANGSAAPVPTWDEKFKTFFFPPELNFGRFLAKLWKFLAIKTIPETV